MRGEPNILFRWHCLTSSYNDGKQVEPIMIHDHTVEWYQSDAFIVWTAITAAFIAGLVAGVFGGMRLADWLNRETKR